VTREDPRGQSATARGARAGFEIRAWFDYDVINAKWYLQTRTDVTHDVRVLRARWAGVVIHVVRVDHESGASSEEQETDRVGSTRHRHVSGVTPRCEVTLGEQALFEVHVRRLRKPTARSARARERPSPRQEIDHRAQGAYEETDW